MRRIVGIVDSKSYSKNNEKTNHFSKRVDRVEMSVRKAENIACFLVVDTENKDYQVHCLYEDASLYIYDYKSKKIITVILLEVKELMKYLKQGDIDRIKKENLIKCAKANRKPNGEKLTRKKRILEGKCNDEQNL